MLFHVEVHRRGATAPDTVLDLGREALERLVLEPYRNGSTLLIDGRTIPVHQIERIRIVENSAPSEVYMREVESYGSFIIRDRAGKVRRVIDQSRDVTRELLDGPPDPSEYSLPSGKPASEDRRKVFLVHGRWQEATDGMADFLRSLGLQVVDWDDAVISLGKGSSYPAEILDAGFRMCHIIVVFMTPDDLTAIHPELNIPKTNRTTLYGQPRPNVIFEAGMAWQRDRFRTLIITFGDLKTLSDISGVDLVKFDNAAESRIGVALRLKGMGATVNMNGKHWLRAGNFPAPLARVSVDQLDVPGS